MESNTLVEKRRSYRGSLWFTFLDPDEVKQLLNIPKELEIAGSSAGGHTG